MLFEEGWETSSPRSILLVRVSDSIGKRLRQSDSRNVLLQRAASPWRLQDNEPDTARDPGPPRRKDARWRSAGISVRPKLGCTYDQDARQ